MEVALSPHIMSIIMNEKLARKKKDAKKENKNCRPEGRV